MSVVGVRTPQSAEEVHAGVLLFVPKVECIVCCLAACGLVLLSPESGRAEKVGRSFSASHVTSSPLHDNFL